MMLTYILFGMVATVHLVVGEYLLVANLDESTDPDTTIIHKVTLPSGDRVNLDITFGDLNRVEMIDYDATSQLLFYVDSNSGGLLAKTAAVDGSTASRIPRFEAEGTDYGPRGIAVDPASSRLYYADYSSENIVTVDEDGGNAKILFDFDDASLRNIAVDYKNGFIFWSDYPDEIKCSYLDGSTEVTMATQPSGAQLQGIEVDMADKMIYWCDHNHNTVTRAAYSAAICGADNPPAAVPQIIYTFPDDLSCRDIAIGQSDIYMIQFDETDSSNRATSIVKMPKPDVGSTTALSHSDVVLVGTAFPSDNYPISIYLNEDADVTSPCSSGTACADYSYCVAMPTGRRCMCTDSATGCTDGDVVTPSPTGGSNTPTPTPAPSPVGGGAFMPQGGAAILCMFAFAIIIQN